MHGHLPWAVKIGQNRGSDQSDSGAIPRRLRENLDLGVNTERERGIIQRQRKITETSKKLEMKKLYQVLIICDDFADSPQLHKPHGALDTLFIRGRRLQISTWVSSQKLRLLSAAGVNQQFLRWLIYALCPAWRTSDRR